MAAHTWPYVHTAMTRTRNKKAGEGPSSRCAELTVVAGGAAVAGVRTVAVKGAPGLGAFAAVLTVVGQTPERRCRHHHSFSLGDTKY